MTTNIDPCKAIRFALIASVIGLISASVALIIVVATPTGPRISFEAAKGYAGELANNDLYEQTVEEYARILEHYRLSDREAGALLFNIGDIAAEHLRDPERSLAAFLKLKRLYPEHPLVEDAERRIIAQLDKLGKPRRAQRLLEKAVSLGRPISGVEPNRIVAKIGDRAIAVDEIDDAIEGLPPQIKSQITDTQAKMEFVKSYIGEQLMFDAALREGFDTRPKIETRMENARRSIIAGAYYNDKVASKIDISASDIEIFYEMHRDKFGGAPLDEVRSKVRDALEMEKTVQAQSAMFEGLIEAEGVQFFPENLEAVETK